MRAPDARRLAGALEPFAGQVYFSPECHRNYTELGFDPSPGDFNGVAGPEMESYFCSRGSVMGQVPGTVIAAAFGVFEHTRVAAIVERGWAKTDAATICDARDRGAVDQLRRILGDGPEGIAEVRTLLERAEADLEPYGKPLYAGQASLPRFDDPLADAWRLADRLREYRGDAHIAAWTTAGLDACAVGLMSERWWGLRARSYSRTRMWADENYDRTEADLTRRGLWSEGDLTAEGRTLRERIEADTDRQCEPIVAALGDDLDRLISLLAPWNRAIQDQRGYPSRGPHDLADASSVD